MTEIYQPKRSGSSKFIELDRLKIHYNEWGPADAPIVFMLHGWMDVGASFQFVVDSLKSDWRVIAPDWRGFGLSDWPVAGGATARNYYFSDYLADLEQLLNAFTPDQPARLVGHSMGANLSMLYAGIRPERVQAVVNLEGFGLPDMGPEKAPKKYAQWLDDLTRTPSMRVYESREAVAGRLIKNNYRLPMEKALYLAQHWSRPVEGGFQVLGDPAHRIPSPFLYKVAEMQAIWAQIKGPVLHVEAKQTEAAFFMFKPGEEPDFDKLRERFHVIENWSFELVDEAGHMVHHDQPERLANLIEKHFDKAAG